MPPVTATVTFIAEDPADLGRIFIALGRALGDTEHQAAAGVAEIDALASPPSGSEPDSSASWYGQNGRRFVERLRPNARKALEVIVREGPTVSFELVRQELGGIKGPRLAGTLASIGAAVKGLGAPAPPFRPDHKRQTYTIEPDIQEVLRVVMT